jgi:RNA polymerase sigma-70 factor (ECF subfamily)
LFDLLRDAALAADATQETFVRAFRQPEAMMDPPRVAPWLFGIARNVSLELRRARARSERVIERGPGGVERASAAAWRSPEAELLDREACRVVDAALSRLSEDRRAVLVLRMDHDFAYEDIAALMGWSVAKVKIEIFRAREVLRATYLEYRGGGR